MSGKKKDNIYSLCGTVFIWPGDAAQWYFVPLPKRDGQKIKQLFGSASRGFGSLPVTVTVGTTIWKTSIFPEKTSGSYSLPLKAEVRKKEDIAAGDTITFTL